jgi:hypothetical protein
MLKLIITLIALAVIAVTMLVRANDLRWRKELKWRARLIGFVISGFSPVGVALCLVQGADPGWYLTSFVVGLSLVFVTTPYLPPWWTWLWKGEPERPSNVPPPVSTVRSDRVQALDRYRDENP